MTLTLEKMLEDIRVCEFLEVTYKLVRIEKSSLPQKNAVELLVDYYQEDNNIFDDESLDIALRIMEMDPNGETSSGRKKKELQKVVEKYILRYLTKYKTLLDETKNILNRGETENGE